MTPQPDTPTHPRQTRQRKDPYQERPGRQRTFVWALRLGLLFITATICGLASLFLYVRWREGTLSPRISVEGSNPNLALAERLYLETYLSARADDLEVAYGPAGPVNFVISPGEAAGQVAANLAAAGLVSDAELFTNYLRFYGLDATLTAGSFRLQTPLTIPELATTLTNPFQDIALNFLPGWRLEEMAAYLAETTPGNLDPQSFLAIAQRREAFDLAPFDFLANHPAGASLEGYLFPGEYLLPVDGSAADLVTMMLTRFGEQVTPAMRQAYGVNGLTLREAVTLASIVARETPLNEERPLIAGVFYNRLALEMPLQADATVQYALGYNATLETWWKAPLDPADLQVDSPYNSYLYGRLPPGPIANPGPSSLQAVAEPADTDFLFFVLDCVDQRSHLFSVTYEEHLENIARCSGG